METHIGHMASGAALAGRIQGTLWSNKKTNPKKIYTSSPIPAMTAKIQAW